MPYVTRKEVEEGIAAATRTFDNFLYESEKLLDKDFDKHKEVVAFLLDRTERDHLKNERLAELLECKRFRRLKERLAKI